MDFTYEKDALATKLETYEWDNVWWEKANDKESPRALYIGDSISCGIRGQLNKLFGEKLRIDGFGTSKGIDNPWFKDAISNFGKQSQNKKIVMFNNGLHGWHLSTEQYGKYYAEMAEFLIKEFDGLKIVLLTSTPTTEEGRRELITERNEKVFEVAKKYSLPVIDIYSFSNGLEQKKDGVHFIEESYARIAEHLASELEKMI